MRTHAAPRLLLSRLLAATALLVLVLAAPAGAAKRASHKPRKAALPKLVAAPPVIGIAEQHPDLFLDPLYQAAGLNHSRLLVGWNGIFDDNQRGQMDAYLNAAHLLNIDVLVTFGNSRANGRDRPTPQQLVQAFRAVRSRYPWVTEFGTWNEPNIQGAAPELTATYWRALTHDCPSCTILAADMVDTANMTRWIKRFRKAARKEPKYWGLHNYVDANLFVATGTRGILNATRGQIWLTETGGVVERNNGSKIAFATGTDHAAAAVKFIFDRLVPMSPRIRRVYLYNWRANPGPSTWDSALTNADGTPRPAYQELRRQLARGSAPKPTPTPCAIKASIPLLPGVCLPTR